MSSRFAHGAVLALVLSVVMAVGCAKRPAMTIAAAPSPSGTPASTQPGSAHGPAAPERPGGDRPGPATAAPAPGSTATSRPAPNAFTAVADLHDIHFDFDRHDIRPQDAEILDMNARWLKAHPSYLVLIEGHCDERGTNEYNLALGQRRAKATVDFLVSRGVAAGRLTTVSYGEERPVCTEKTNRCWATNRRAHFLGKAG